MKTKSILAAVALICAAGAVQADTTFDPINRYSWSANTGWLDWYANNTSGAVFTNKVLSGYMWSPNIGWIHLGDGTPANGNAYANNSASDYGVNVGAGDATFHYLTGYAWSGNIGWINFDVSSAGTQYRARVHKTTGELSGYAWSANAGWIVLDGGATGAVTGLTGVATQKQMWMIR